MNTRWYLDRERVETDARQDSTYRTYFMIVWAIVLITLLWLLTLATLNLLRPDPITPEPAPTAAPDAYITPVAHITPAPAPEPEPTTPLRYKLTAAERDIIEKTVMAEGGNTEDEEGLMYISQCILNACERSGVRPDEAVEIYQYAQPAEEVNDWVREAVARVFDNGETATSEKILFFYAPKYVESSWHESLTFVVEHGGHRFFKLREDENGL